MATTKQQSYNEQVKSRNKSTINGYIREIEGKSFSNHSFYRNIPMIINYLCMKYYHQSKDRFHPELHGKDVTVINENVIKQKSTGGSIQSAFLSNIVTDGIHHWTFKMGKVVHFLGICSNKDISKHTKALFYMKQPESFGLNLIIGCLRGNAQNIPGQYCPNCKEGDKVEMHLDLNQMELKFIINDKDYGKAFDIPSGEYRVGICLYRPIETVELIRYDTK